MLGFCQDCKKRCKDVQLRQSDYRLCSECDNVRKGVASKSNNRPSIAAAIATPPRLQGSIQNLQALIDEHTPSKNNDTNATNNQQPSNGLANYVESLKNKRKEKPVAPQRCKGPECQIKTGDACCPCFICQKDFHLHCVGLSRRPPKSSNWCCKNCSSFPAIIRQLHHAVTTLTTTQNSLQTEQTKLKKSYEDLLQENIQLRSELEALKSDRTSSTDPSVDSTQLDHFSDEPSACLIVGDSILRDFDNTFENTQVKSISGATMSDIFNELEGRKDLNTFSDVIIHAGTNDISKNIAIDDSLTSLEAIVTLIMLKAPTARIHISAVCPRTKGQVQHKVETINAAFKDLSSRLDCNFIDSGLQMTYRNGCVDDSQLADGLHLSKRGRETMVNLFANSIERLTKSCGEWHTVTKRQSASKASQSNRYVRSHNKSRRGPYNSSNFSRKTRETQPLPTPRPRQSRASERHNTYDDVNQHVGNHYRGCYNCGLKNHNQKTCFHTERLKCRSCNRLGHKANYCYKNKNVHSIH